MNYRLIAPAVVAFVAMSCSASGGVASSSFVAGSTELAIDGVACGKLFSFEGGDPRASAVVVSNPGGTALAKKQISGVSYAPITVEVAFPPAPPLLGWIGDLCANRQTRKTLLLTTYNANGQVAGNSLQATDALLTEVRFPAFDVASKDAVRLTLVFTPGSSQTSPASVAKSAGASSKNVSGSDFRIKIGTLPTTRVARIEPFTIKQPISENASGELRKFGPTAGTTEFSNLILTIASADIADWNKWRDSFVVNGNSRDKDETTGSLELLSLNTTTPLFALQFSNVGIIRASPVKEGTGDAVGRFQAELYCEGMAPGTAPAMSSTSVATDPAATLTPITAMTPATAQLATLMPVAGTTPAGSAAAGGAVSSAAGSGAAGGGAAGATATPAGNAGAGGASAGTGSSGTSAAGGAAQAAATPGATSAAGGAAAASGNTTAAGGGAAGAAVTPASNSTVAVAPASSGGSAAGASGGAAASGPAATTAAGPVIDQGARDPKDIPRPEGIVRKSFSSVRQKTYSQEIAAYSSKSTPDTLEEFYTKSLTGAGWELSTRVENNGSIANTHQIVLTWKNGLRSVMITLAEVKAGGAEIGVNLTTKFAP